MERRSHRSKVWVGEMTCSTSIEEMLTRPTRMAFIEFEATHALSCAECRWPAGSYEQTFWLEVYQKKNPRLVEPGVSIPHQRDDEMATKSSEVILA